MSNSYVNLTDEYSDYGPIRSMLGAIGVVGFGITTGVSLMRLNNSAFLKSISREWEIKHKFKYDTGSILSTGTAMNKSKLLRQSIENSINLGSKTPTDLKPHDEFMQRVLIEQDRLRKEKFLKKQELAKALEEQISDAYELGREVHRKSGIFTNGILQLTDNNFSTDYKNILKQLISNNNTLLNNVDGDKIILRDKGLYKKITSLFRERLNKLAKQDIKTVNKNELKYLQHELGLLQVNPNNVNIDRLSDPKNKWIVKKLQLNIKGTDPLRWKDETGRNIYSTKRIQLQDINSILSKAQSLPARSEQMQRVSLMVNDILSKVQGITSIGSFSSSELEYVHRASFILEDFIRGNSTSDELDDTLSKLKQTLDHAGHPIPEIDEAISQAFDLQRKLTKDIQNINKITKIKNKGKLHNRLTINEYLEILTDSTKSTIEDSMNLLADVSKNSLGEKKSELDIYLESIKKVNSRLRNSVASKEVLKTKESVFRFESRMESRILNVTDRQALRLSRFNPNIKEVGTRNILNKFGKYKIPNILEGNFIQFDPLMESGDFVEFALDHANYIRKTTGSVAGNRLFDIYAGVGSDVNKMNSLQKVLHFTSGASVQGKYVGLNNKFAQTFLHEDRGFNKIIKKLKETYGADKVTTAFRVHKNDAITTIRLIAERNGEKFKPIDIEMPIMLNNMLFKNHRAYIAENIVTGIDKKIHMQTSLDRYFEELTDSIEYQKSAIQTSLDKTTIETSLSDLQKAFTGKQATFFGLKGNSGTLNDITYSSELEALKISQSVNHHVIKSASSRPRIEAQKRKLDILESQYYRMHMDPNVDRLTRKAFLKELRHQRRRLAKLQHGKIEKVYKLVNDLSRADVFDIDGMSHSIDYLMRETHGLFSPTVSSAGAVNLMKGKFSMLEGISAFLPPDIARNMKAIYNTMDTLDLLRAKMFARFHGYTFSGNKNIYDEEKALLRGILSARNRDNTYKTSPLYQKTQDYKIGIRREISGLTKKLANIQKDNPYTRSIYQKARKWIAEKHNLRIDQITDRIFIDNYEEFKNMQADKLKDQLLKKQRQLKLAKKIEDRLSMHDFARGFIYEADDELDKLSESIGGKKISEIIASPFVSNKTTNFIARDTHDFMEAMGYVFKDNTSFNATLDATDAFGIRSMRTFLVDGPGFSDGITVLSRRGAEAFGQRIKRNETSNLSINELKKILRNELSKNTNDLHRTNTLNKVIKMIDDISKISSDKKVKFGTNELVKELGGKSSDFRLFIDTMNDLLQSGNSKLLKYAGQQNALIRHGDALPVFAGFVLDKNKLKVSYHMITSAIPGSKIVNETTDKYLVNSILEDKDMLRLQRGLLIRNFDSGVLSRNAHSDRIRRFVNNFRENDHMWANTKQWNRFRSLLSQNGDQSLLHIADHYGNTVFDMIGSNARQKASGNRAINRGRLESLFRELLNVKIDKYSARTSMLGMNKNAKVVKSLYEELFTEILDQFQDPTAYTKRSDKFMGTEPGNISDRIKIVTNPKRNAVSIKVGEKNLSNLYESILDIRDIAKAGPQAISEFKESLRQRILKKLDNPKYTNTFNLLNTPVIFKKFITDIMGKIDNMIAVANPHNPFRFEDTSLMASIVSQDPFELFGTSVRGSYNSTTGYTKGAKPSIYDALILKLNGMPHIGNKIINFQKHGRGYTQHYLSSVMTIMGMDPSKFINLANPNTASAQVQSGQASALLSQDILKFRARLHNASWDATSGLVRNQGIKGALDVGSDIDAAFLEKGIFLRDTLTNGNYDDVLKKDYLDTLKAEVTGFQGKNNFQAGLKEFVEDKMEEINIRGFVDEKDAQKQMKMWLGASSRLRADQVQEYQKLTRKYKRVAFGVDPNSPKFTLFMNQLKGRQIYGSHIHAFGKDEMITPERIQQMFDMGIDNRDIALIRQGYIGESPNKSNIVMLNDFHQSQLAYFRALNYGAPTEVLQLLENERFERLVRFTGRLQSQTLKKGLPGTVRNAGRGLMTFDHTKANIWSIVKGLSDSQFDIDGSMKAMLNSNFKGVSYEDATATVRNLLSKQGDKQAELHSFFLKMMKAGKDNISNLAPGELVMSRETFMNGLSTLVDDSNRNKITETWKRMLGAHSHETFMSLGIRYPTLKSHNIMPMSVSIFDGNIFETIGIRSVQRELSKQGLTNDALFINMIDAKQFGGDLDRDMFYSILGLDSEFGPGSQYQKELENTMSKQMSVRWTTEDINGNKAIVVTDKLTKQETRGGDLIRRISTDISSDYEKNIMDGMSHNDALNAALSKNKVESGTITTMDDKGDKISKTYFTGKDRELLFSEKTISSLAPKARGYVDTRDIWKRSKRFRGRVLSSLEDKIDLSIESLFEPRHIEDVLHKNRTANSLLTSFKTNVDTNLEALKRQLELAGESRYNIELKIQHIKEEFANMPTDKLHDKFDKAFKNKDLNALLRKEFREELPALTGSITALKSMTGEIHNIGKYTLANIGLTFYANDKKMARELVDWAGDLSQSNISAKHKIPLITGDVISTIKTILSPNASSSDLADAQLKIRKGEFSAFMSSQELQEIVGMNKIIRENADKLTSKHVVRHTKRIEDLSKRIESGGVVSNVEYKDYLVGLREVATESNYVRDALGLQATQSMEELSKAISGTSKSIRYSQMLGNRLIEDRERIIKTMRMAGFNRFEDMTYASKTLLSNLSLSGYRGVKALQSLVNSPMAIESAIGDVFMDQRTTRLIEKSADSLFHSESVIESINKQVGNRISKKINGSKLQQYVDADSFSRLGGFGIAGLAVVGFIGAFGISSNKREWLGPTPGFGGEYAERMNSKNEERERGLSTIQRLKSRHIRTGSMNFADGKSARILPTGIRKQTGPSFSDQIREIAAGDNIMEARDWHRFR